MSFYRNLLIRSLDRCSVSKYRAADARPYFTEPSLSPDRKEIAFVSGGDIWTVPATGGVAALLVSHSANEARPLYSPDGRQLAFISISNRQWRHLSADARDRRTETSDIRRRVSINSMAGPGTDAGSTSLPRAAMSVGLTICFASVQTAARRCS